MFKSNCFFYDQNGNRYWSKYDAVNSSNQIYLYYFDWFYQAQNWTVEPQTNLRVLYHQRAQKIRDEYEYVALAYSGGIDSTNVLESFYYNNLHIDEIIIAGAFSRDSATGSDENHNGEIYHNCFETLKQLSLPRTKISIIDYTENMNSYSLIKQDDWYREIGSYYSYHHWFWYDIQSRYEGSKKTALVFGIDKPLVEWDENNKAYTQFLDLCLLSYGFTTNRFNQKNNAERLNFYWHPDAFAILSKQCHLIKNFYDSYVGPDKMLTFDQFWERYTSISSQLIYDVKHKLKFISPKSTTRLLSLRDTYSQRGNDFAELEIFKNYTQGVRKLGESKFTNPVYSQKYYLDLSE